MGVSLISSAIAYLLHLKCCTGAISSSFVHMFVSCHTKCSDAMLVRILSSPFIVISSKSHYYILIFQHIQFLFFASNMPAHTNVQGWEGELHKPVHTLPSFFNWKRIGWGVLPKSWGVQGNTWPFETDVSFSFGQGENRWYEDGTYVSIMTNWTLIYHVYVCVHLLIYTSNLQPHIITGCTSKHKYNDVQKQVVLSSRS